jgi:hypothetical protein
VEGLAWGGGEVRGRVDINAIVLSEDRPFRVAGEEPLVLGPLAKVNVFVGPNNAGKSRLMRWMFAEWDGRVRLGGELQGAAVEADRMFLACLDPDGSLAHRHAENAADSALSVVRPGLFADLRADAAGRNVANLHRRPTMTVPKEVQNQRAREADRRWAAGTAALERLPLDAMRDTKRAYIPILRSLRRHGDGDILADRVRKDHDWQSLNQLGALKLPGAAADSPPDAIFTGQGLYERLQAMLLGTLQQRRAVALYEQFLGETFFQGKPVSLIPRLGEDHLFVKVGDEREFAIHELGDGVQAVILLTFLPFTVPEPTLFFIEEPELHTHPGLQRILLNAMTATTGPLAHHTFFLTTHSNHLLELTADHGNISIFRLEKRFDDAEDEKTAKDEEKTPRFEVTALKAGDRGILESLGVRAASVFLVNATLWVEGITDRWFFGVLLAALREKLKADGEEKGHVLRRLDEDLHWAFVEYAGGNITHWSFLDEEGGINVDTLCSRLLLVVDQDGRNKIERHDKLRERLGDRLIVLPRRELENMVPASVWKTVVLTAEQSKRPGKKGDESQEAVFEPRWEDYADEPIGTYIAANVRPEAKVSWAGDSGTLGSKVDRWRNRLMPELKQLKFEDFPDEVQELAKKMHRFLLKEVYGDEEPYVPPEASR